MSFLLSRWPAKQRSFAYHPTFSDKFTPSYYRIRTTYVNCYVKKPWWSIDHGWETCELRDATIRFCPEPAFTLTSGQALLPARWLKARAPGKGWVRITSAFKFVQRHFWFSLPCICSYYKALSSFKFVRNISTNAMTNQRLRRQNWSQAETKFCTDTQRENV